MLNLECFCVDCIWIFGISSWGLVDASEVAQVVDLVVG